MASMINIQYYFNYISIEPNVAPVDYALLTRFIT